MQGRGAGLSLGSAVASWATWCVLCRDLFVDDACIYFRFAQHLRAGWGWVWNSGGMPVDSVSSPLWTLLLVPFAGSSRTLEPAAKLLGIACALAAIGLAVRTAAVLAGKRAAHFAALLFFASPLLAFHAASGMETALAAAATAALGLAAVQTLRDGTSTRAVRRGALAFGTAWWLGALARPEIALYGAVAAALVVARIPAGRRRDILPYLLAAAALPAAVVLAARMALFGHLTPLPYLVKRGGGVTSMGVGYIALALSGLLGGGLAVLVRGARGNRDGPLRRATAVLVAPALACVLAYAFFRPMMGYVYRFAVPFWMPVVVAASATLARRWESGRRGGAALVLTALLAYHVIAVLPIWHQVRIVTPAARAVHVAFGRLLGEISSEGRLLALHDVGAAAYYSGWEAYEGAGLVTPEVLRRGRTSAQLVADLQPDVIFLAQCRTERLGAAAGGDYVLVASLPWLVFTEGGPADYQCVYCRADWSLRERLAARLRGVGSPPRRAPWYFTAYRRLKTIFRL